VNDGQLSRASLLEVAKRLVLPVPGVHQVCDAAAEGLDVANAESVIVQEEVIGALLMEMMDELVRPRSKCAAPDLVPTDLYPHLDRGLAQPSHFTSSTMPFTSG
jgi:hypothetical protein